MTQQFPHPHNSMTLIGEAADYIHRLDAANEGGTLAAFWRATEAERRMMHSADRIDILDRHSVLTTEDGNDGR